VYFESHLSGIISSEKIFIVILQKKNTNRDFSRRKFSQLSQLYSRVSSQDNLLLLTTLLHFIFKKIKIIINILTFWVPIVDTPHGGDVTCSGCFACTGKIIKNWQNGILHFVFKLSQSSEDEKLTFLIGASLNNWLMIAENTIHHSPSFLPLSAFDIGLISI